MRCASGEGCSLAQDKVMQAVHDERTMSGVDDGATDYRFARGLEKTVLPRPMGGGVGPLLLRAAAAGSQHFEPLLAEAESQGLGVELFRAGLSLLDQGRQVEAAKTLQAALRSDLSDRMVLHFLPQTLTSISHSSGDGTDKNDEIAAMLMAHVAKMLQEPERRSSLEGAVAALIRSGRAALLSPLEKGLGPEFLPSVRRLFQWQSRQDPQIALDLMLAEDFASLEGLSAAELMGILKSDSPKDNYDLAYDLLNKASTRVLDWLLEMGIAPTALRTSSSHQAELGWTALRRFQLTVDPIRFLDWELKQRDDLESITREVLDYHNNTTANGSSDMFRVEVLDWLLAKGVGLERIAEALLHKPGPADRCLAIEALKWDEVGPLLWLVGKKMQAPNTCDLLNAEWDNDCTVTKLVKTIRISPEGISVLDWFVEQVGPRPVVAALLEKRSPNSESALGLAVISGQARIFDWLLAQNLSSAEIQQQILSVFTDPPGSECPWVQKETLTWLLDHGASPDEIIATLVKPTGGGALSPLERDFEISPEWAIAAIEPLPQLQVPAQIKTGRYPLELSIDSRVIDEATVKCHDWLGLIAFIDTPCDTLAGYLEQALDKVFNDFGGRANDYILDERLEKLLSGVPEPKGISAQGAWLRHPLRLALVHAAHLSSESGLTEVERQAFLRQELQVVLGDSDDLKGFAKYVGQSLKDLQPWQGIPHVADMVNALGREVVQPVLLAYLPGSVDLSDKERELWNATKSVALKLLSNTLLTTADWLKASRAWHRLDRKGPQPPLVETLAWGPFFREEFRASNGITARVLTSSEELGREGQALEHCVAGYAQDCAEGRCHIISFRTAEQEAVGTLRIGLDSQGTWLIDGQLYAEKEFGGRRNERPPAAAAAAKNELLAALVDGALAVDHYTYAVGGNCGSDFLSPRERLSGYPDGTLPQYPFIHWSHAYSIQRRGQELPVLGGISWERFSDLIQGTIQSSGLNPPRDHPAAT
jgi:hypothetical protein